MDNILIRIITDHLPHRHTMAYIRKKEGFEGQILHVIPRPMLKNLTQNILLHQLMATDIGWFPNALHHYCERANGIPEHILILCVKGKGWYEINGSREILQANQALLIPRNTPHIYGADLDDPWSIHWVHFTGLVSNYFSSLLKDEGYSISVSSESLQSLEHLFKNCYDVFLGSFVWHRMVYVTQTLQYILGNLFFNNPSFSPALNSSHFQNLGGVLDYLNKNIEKSLSLQEISDKANLSKSHFSRLFKEQTGFSPMDYFIHLKIQHASMLLSFTDHSIRQISHELGYQDPYYFSRLFKKIIGVSPTDFRKLPKQTELI